MLLQDDPFADNLPDDPFAESGGLPDDPFSEDQSGGAPPPIPPPPPLAPSLKRRPPSRLESAGGSFASGFGNIISSLPKAVGEGAVSLANKFGDDPIWGNPEKITPEETTAYKVGESIDKWFNKFAVNPAYREEFIASKVPEALGSAGAFIVGGLAGAAAKIPAAATTVTMGVASGGVEGVQDYLSTLEKDEKADPKIREQAYYWNGVFGASEAAPIVRLLDRLDGVTGGGVKRVLTEGVKGGIEELVQEVLQSIWKNYGAKDVIGYDKERGMFSGTQEGAEVGFTVGFLMNSLAATIGAKRVGRVRDEAQAPKEPVIDDAVDAEDVIGGVSVGTEEDVVGHAVEPTTVASDAVAPPPEAEVVDQQEIPYFDVRLKRDSHRAALDNMVNELVAGGGIELYPDPEFKGGESDVRDEIGQPVAPLVRSQSLNPDWFKSMNQTDEYSMSVKDTQKAVEKAIAGERLGVRQSRVVGLMLDEIQEGRESGLEYAREQLQFARDARAAAGMPDAQDWLFEESDYPDSADGMARTFMEFQQHANGINSELAGQVEDLLDSQRSDQEILSDIIRLFEVEHGRKIEAGYRGYQGPEERSGVQSAGIEPITGEYATERDISGIPTGYARDGLDGRVAQPVSEGEVGGILPVQKEKSNEEAVIEPAPEVETVLPEIPPLELDTQTEVDIAAKEERATDENVAKKEQVDRESEFFELEGQVTSKEEKPTGDLFAEPIKKKHPGLKKADKKNVDLPKNLSPIHELADGAQVVKGEDTDVQEVTTEKPKKKHPGLKKKPVIVEKKHQEKQDVKKTTTGVKNNDAAKEVATPKPIVDEKAIDEAANEAATSPKNDLPTPTEKQIKAGVYKKGHVSINGLNITIENPEGSERSGTDERGNKWKTVLRSHYGYFKRTEGADGDHVDVFVGPDAENADLPVFIVDQVDPNTGTYDEHKIMLGWPSEAKARAAYLDNYAKGWKGIGAITEMPLNEFKVWLKDGDTTKPLAKLKPAKKTVAEKRPAKPLSKKVKKHLATITVEYSFNDEKLTGRASSKAVGDHVIELKSRIGELNKLIACLKG